MIGGFAYWALGVIVGLPIVVLVVSELHLRLVRSGNALARPVNLLRVLLLPAVGLLILLTQAAGITAENNGVRTVATLVGVLTIVVALGGLNAVLFGNAETGTWRERLPDIFVDLARLILVVAGGAVVASIVWGFDVGGLWATLGVGSVVLGLALQGAVGGIVSGLLVLFEQPFTLGDIITVDGKRGKVVEVTWRSTQLSIGNGNEILVVPNATLADASFSNQSRPTPAYDQSIVTTFGAGDHPREVIEMLTAVGAAVPGLRPGAAPVVLVDGGLDADGDYLLTYTTKLPLVSTAAADQAKTSFHLWLWYAARRRGLGLGGEAYAPAASHQVAAALTEVRHTLDLRAAEVDEVAAQCRLLTYGQGEVLLTAGAAPDALLIVVSGSVELSSLDGEMVAELGEGEILGPELVDRRPTALTATALIDVDVIEVPADVVDRLVASKPYVARSLDNLIAIRAQQVELARL